MGYTIAIFYTDYALRKIFYFVCFIWLNHIMQRVSYRTAKAGHPLVLQKGCDAVVIMQWCLYWANIS